MHAAMLRPVVQPEGVCLHQRSQGRTDQGSKQAVEHARNGNGFFMSSAGWQEQQQQGSDDRHGEWHNDLALLFTLFRNNPRRRFRLSLPYCVRPRALAQTRGSVEEAVEEL